MYFQGGNSPGVELVFVNFNVIVVVRQALAETAHPHAPRARLLQRILKIRSESGHGHASRPALASSAALVTVAANEVFLFGFYVAEARDVDSIGTVTKGHFIFVSGHDAAGSAAHVMIHQVVAEFAAAVR